MEKKGSDEKVKKPDTRYSCAMQTRRWYAYHELVGQLDVVEEVSEDADEGRGADPEADEEQHVVVPEVLRRGAVGPVDQQPRRAAASIRWNGRPQRRFNSY